MWRVQARVTKTSSSWLLYILRRVEWPCVPQEPLFPWGTVVCPVLCGFHTLISRWQQLYDVQSTESNTSLPYSGTLLALSLIMFPEPSVWVGRGRITQMYDYFLPFRGEYWTSVTATVTCSQYLDYLWISSVAAVQSKNKLPLSSKVDSSNSLWA